MFCLAQQDGEAIGYLKLNTGPAQTEQQAEGSMEIERIYLLRAYQGGGYGQKLMEHAIDCAKQMGMRFIWLGVWEQNQTALRFYNRNGFVRFGEHIFKLGADEQLDYLMGKSI